MIKKFNIDDVIEYIRNSSNESKIYIGCDSEKIKVKNVWYADYITVVVIHIDGNHGCKIFGNIERERDYDVIKKKPINRLRNEVYKAANMYLNLHDVIGDREVEIHLDLNPNTEHFSSSIVPHAIGYIKGVCNQTPKIKPFAFAASYGADRYKEIQSIRKI